MSPTPELREDAVEYVLGLMDAEERRAFEIALLDDPELADAVWRAEEAFVPLARALPPRRPPAGLFRKVERRTFGAAVAPRRTGSRFEVSLWRGATTFFFTTTVAALTLAVIFAARPDLVTEPRPELVAGIVTGGGEVLLARVRQDGTLAVSALPRIDTDTSRELWLVPEDGAPRSLGLLDTAEPRVFPLPPQVREELGRGASLAVSIEPPGGSPTGAPTGEIIGVGPLTEI